ncbi:hypothetical protein NFI95_03765 [Acetobacteraceae bacterium KSS8]|uniref:Uncharacterized protein n=1 Tax=Endosaccharibacter trunci TaxID=2812733 RepID=A0ABT1W3W3_9PROT|nr:hypothetical protein [Acetobacteraceae bacterium KSS8]
MYTREGISLDRDDILNEFNARRQERKGLEISGSFCNDPGTEHAYVFDHAFVKAFFRSGASKDLHIGSHFAYTGREEGHQPTDLVFLPHHNKEIQAAKAAARAKLVQAKRYDPNNASASDLNWIINCSKEEYRQRYRGSFRVILRPGP